MMNVLILMLFNPTKAFDKMKRAEKFSFGSMLLVLFLLLVNLILMVPVISKVSKIVFSSMSLPDNQIDTATQIAYKMRYMQVAGTEIMYIFMFLMYALLLYLFVRISKNRLEYKKGLQLVVNCYFIVAIGDLMNTALLYVRGLENIQNMYDTSLIGLNVLFSVDRVGATFYTFLSSITPFQIAYVVLLSVGLKILTGMKGLKASLICILLWLITILFPVLSVYFSESVMTV